MSNPDANRIPVSALIERALVDCAKRGAEGKTLTASYITEYEGEQFVITINPVDCVLYHCAGRESIH